MDLKKPYTLDEQIKKLKDHCLDSTLKKQNSSIKI